jgi:transposase
MVNSSEQQSEFEASLESKEENCPTKVFPVDESCPVCGEKIYKSGRCITCYSCGWSTCSI